MASLDLKSPEFWDPSAVDRELRRVYDICSGCRRCLPLCPTFQDRMLGNTELIGKLGRLTAPLSNWMNELAVHRAFMHAVAGIHKNRNLPKFHRQTFSAWFKSRARRGATAGNASAAGVPTGG